ncbi:neprilysin-1-like [Ornithodoros turicata]|uniref:neprilysin-1-like n=1 Tax=Ornithodoros turicata TaxID=34597 RepID=UPI0031389D38
MPAIVSDSDPVMVPHQPSKDDTEPHHDPRAPSTQDNSDNPGADNDTYKRVSARVAAVSLLLAVVIGGALLLLFYTSMSVSHEALTTCSSPECADARIYIEAIINPNVDPCQDFHTHVCAKWLQRHAREGFLKDALSHFLVRLHDTIQRLAAAPEPQSVFTRSVTSLYNSCRTFLSANTSVQDVTRSALSTLDVSRISSCSTLEEVLEAILQLSLTDGVASALEIRFRKALNNTFLHILWGGNLRSKFLLSENNEIFEHHINDVVAATKFNATFQEVLALDRDIGSVPVATMKIYIMPLSAIDDMGPPFSVQFWKNALGAVIPSVKETYDVQPIVATGFAQIKHTLLVLRSVPLRRVKAYLSIYALAAVLAFHFSARYRSLSFVEQTRVCLEATKTALTLHWQTIINATMPGTKSRDEATKIFSTIKESLSSKLPNWMDTRTQAKSKIKLRNVRLRFYRDDVDNTPFGDVPPLEGDFVKDYYSLLAWSRRWQLKFPSSSVLDEQEEAELTGSPLYSDKHESLFMPTYLQQRPILYSGSVEFYFNYGTLGSLIAKELAEAIGPNEHNVKILGGHKNWWTSASRQRFDDASKCYKPSVQRAQVKVDQVPKFTNDLANSLFVWSHAARIAYDSTVKELSTTNYRPTHAKRIFFVRFCLLSCDSVDAGAARERCMVPLMHMPEFADVFNCPNISTMSLQQRCSYL